MKDKKKTYCAHCRKSVNKEYAVQSADKYYHQQCFQEAL